MRGGVVGERAGEVDGDPMSLVRVVAGHNLVVRAAQLHAELGLALQRHFERLRFQAGNGEHLSVAGLEHRRFLAEWECLDRAFQVEAEASQLPRRHPRSSTTTGICRSVFVWYSS